MARRILISFKAWPSHKEAWAAVAKARGKTLSDWICGILNAAAGIPPEHRRRPDRERPSPPATGAACVAEEISGITPQEAQNPHKTAAEVDAEQIAAITPSTPLCFKCERARRVGQTIPKDCPDCRMIGYDPFEGL